MTDTIEREILIAAPIERVWDIVTTPEHMGRWFGDAGAERDGDIIKMRWAEHGEAELRVVREEPPTRFAYRWDANVAGHRRHARRVHARPEGDGTRVQRRRVRLDRSSHAAPSARRELREGNVGGWKHELGDLERYAQTVTV